MWGTRLWRRHLAGAFEFGNVQRAGETLRSLRAIAGATRWAVAAGQGFALAEPVLDDIAALAAHGFVGLREVNALLAPVHRPGE